MPPYRNLTPEEIGYFLRRSRDMEKKSVSFRLTTEARELLNREADRMGISRTATIEVIIREFCRDQEQVPRQADDKSTASRHRPAKGRKRQ